MNVRELQERYADGERDFANIDLYGANLVDIVLTGANLAGATLFSVNLEGADLRDVNLENANLQQANLTAVDLTGANLTGAILRRANLTDASLDKAICEGTVFTGATLPNGQLYSNMSDSLDLNEDQALTKEEIKQDLRKVQKPKPSTAPKPRQPRKGWEEFIQEIPKLPLILFTTSYIGFAFLLIKSPYANHPLFWLILLACSSLWRLSFDYTWIIPAINAFIVLFANDIPIILLALMVGSFLMVWVNSQFTRSLSSKVALRESLWMVSVAFSLLVSLVAGQPILIGSIIVGTVGMTLPLHMDTERFPYRQILQVTTLSAVIGSLIGIVIQKV
ncbi:MAG: pentapeptide repeat-containing protein [Cyanobacteria bacterium P01_A01_bin.80]